jgi:hypothetical protein
VDGGAAAPPSWPQSVAAAIGLQFLAAVPAAIYQAIVELENLLLFPLGVPVLAGGRSAVLLFEETVRAVCGDRRDMMLDNAWWFFSLAGTQMLAIGVVMAWRRRRRGNFCDPVVIGLWLLVAVNAALAVRWPWWGT